MHNHYIRDKKPTSQNRTLSYVGYFCPHPLEETMVLRITFNKDTDNTDANDANDTSNVTNNATNESAIKEIEYMDVLKEHCVRSLAYLQELQNAWLEQNKE